ncbi:MAG: hypothetical protein ACLFVJ_09030 [Persicimonas sp.]
MSNNHKPDPFRDLFDDNELSSLFDEEDEELATGESFDEDDDPTTCPGCGGKGRYIGLFEIEDPCQECGGTGAVRVRSGDGQTELLP